MSAAGRRCYELQGLRLRSEVPLTEPAVSCQDGFDVDVRWGPESRVPQEAPPGSVVAEGRSGTVRLYTAARDDAARDSAGAYLLRFHGVCDVAISGDLRSLECRPDPSYGREFVPILLSGTVVAFLLGLSGHCVLHGSAVAVGGSALAVVGHSGTGKSTVAALLCAAGAGLVTDDVLRLSLGTSTVACVGRCSELRLRPGAVSILESFRSSPPVRQTADDRMAVQASSPTAGRPHLTAMVVPRPSRDGRGLRLVPVRGAEAVFHLLGLGRIQTWNLPEVTRAQFEAVSRLALIVPLFEAHIPWGPPFAPDLGRQLLEQVGLHP